MPSNGNLSVDLSSLPTCWCELRSNAYSATYKGFNLVTVLVIIPILGFCGACSNIVNVYIFNLRRKSCTSRSKSSTFVYLIALSISHGLISVFGCLIIWLDSAKAYNTFLRRYGSWLIRRILPMGIVTSTCSAYYTVGATIERFLRAFSNSCCGRCFREKVATLVVFMILLWSIVYNSVRVMEMECVQCWEEENNRTEYEICPTKFSRSAFMTVYNRWISTMVGTLLPFSLLFVLNALMIAMLRVRRGRMRTANLGMSMARLAAGQVKQRRPQKKRVLLLRHKTFRRQVLKIRGLFNLEHMEVYNDKALVVVVLMFLLCNSVDVAITIAQQVVLEPTVDFLVMLHYLVDIKNVLTMISASVNIVIYYTCDRAYRSVFKLKILRLGAVVPGLQSRQDSNIARSELLSSSTSPKTDKLTYGVFLNDVPALDAAPADANTADDAYKEESNHVVNTVDVGAEKAWNSQISRSFSDGTLSLRGLSGNGKLPGNGLHPESIVAAKLLGNNHSMSHLGNSHIEQEPLLSDGFISPDYSDCAEVYV